MVVVVIVRFHLGDEPTKEHVLQEHRSNHHAGTGEMALHHKGQRLKQLQTTTT